MPRTNLDIRTLIVSPTRQIFPKVGSEGNVVYKVLKVKILKHKDSSKVGQSITVKGDIHPVVIGAEYEAAGEPVFDAKYREWQLQVHNWTEIRSAGKIGITKYLVQCEGVGQVLADRIYSIFGDESVEKLAASDADNIARQLRVSTGKSETIKCWAIAEGANAELKQLLFKSGLQPSQVAKAMKHFGQDAHRRIKDNCYDLTSFPGFGFKSVDAIAMRLGVDIEDKGRIRQGLIYSINSYCDESGSVCCSWDRLVFLACEILKVDKELVIEQLRGLENDGIFICE